jgi:hypothetical protein
VSSPSPPAGSRIEATRIIAGPIRRHSPQAMRRKVDAVVMFMSVTLSGVPDV